MASPSSPPPSPPLSKKPKTSPAASDDEDDEAPSLPPASPECATAAAAAAASADPAAKPKWRYKRRKTAIFIAYCGAGYQGMQKNPGARTIEGDLEEALFLAGAVSLADRGVPRRYDWARAARTDKGVSAVGQVVSGRFYVDPPGFVDRLNSHLDPRIRVLGYKRTTASFNAKKFCDRRRYLYLIPVFALDPNAHPDRESVAASLGSGNELAKCLECSERGRKVAGLMGGRDSRVLIGGGGGERGDLADDDKPEKSEGGGEGSGGLNPDDGVAAEHQGGAMEEEEGKSVFAEPVTQVNSMEVDDGLACNGQQCEAAAFLEPVVGVNSMEVEEDGLASRNGQQCEAAAAFVRGDEKDSGDAVETGGDGIASGISSEFVYDEEVKRRFNSVLKRFVGTHNFHNFTTRTKAEDPSARRYILSFSAETVINIDGVEFIKCEVVGQSFMLHQIRKMIGLAVAIMRNCTPDSLMDVALRQDVNINVPMAPEVGLFLDECFFASYNKKWKDTHEELSMEPYAEQAEDFKMKNIYSHIASMELKEGAVALWLHSLNRRNFPDFHYLEKSNGECVNAEELPPATAVVV